MLNRLYEPMFLSLSYAPPTLCRLSLQIFSSFLTGMAKEVRTSWTLNLNHGLRTGPRSKKIMQWSDPERMQTGPRCAAHGSQAW